MPLNPSDNTIDVEPLGLKRAFLYLFHGAVKDFSAAVTTGRKLRDRKISREEFSAAIDQRFPPPNAVL
jgi:hypothetical protein